MPWEDARAGGSDCRGSRIAGLAAGRKVAGLQRWAAFSGIHSRDFHDRFAPPHFPVNLSVIEATNGYRWQPWCTKQ